MKILKTMLLLSVMLDAKSQNLQTIKTYFDPHSKTQLEEVYTVIVNTPKKHGIYKRYDKGGTLVEEATLSQNQINGVHKVYYGSEWNLPDSYLVGKIHILETYTNGVLSGLSEQYQYIGDKKFYLWQRTYSNGDLIKEITYYNTGAKSASVQTNGPCVEWYENGQKSAEFTNKNKEMDGEYISWYADGGLMAKATFSAGSSIGKSVYYFPNGSIQTEKEYNNAHVLVKVIEYFPHGKPKLERLTSDAQKYKEFVYDSLSGNTTTETDFLLFNESGESRLILDGVKLVFYPSGKKLAVANYKLGRAQGMYQQWYENENLKEEGFYSDSKETGKWKFYFENGSLEREVNYD